MSTGAGVYAYQFADANGPARPGFASEECDRGWLGGRFQKSDRRGPNPTPTTNQAVQEALFENLLNNTTDWTPHRVDRLFHWSRAVKDAQGHLDESPENIQVARRAHRDRMKRLQEKTQQLQVADQSKQADTARSSLEAAESDLAGPASRTTDSPAQTQEPPSRELQGPRLPRGQYRLREAAASAAKAAAPSANPPARVFLVSRVKIDLGSQSRRSLPSLPRPISRSGHKLSSRSWKNPSPPRSQTKRPWKTCSETIKNASQGEKGPSLPIYVDPVGLQEAEKTMASTVKIDLDGVPLKTTLRLMLKQLGLAYCVRDGVLIISSPDGIMQELKEAMREAPPEVLETINQRALFPIKTGGFQ